MEVLQMASTYTKGKGVIIEIEKDGAFIPVAGQTGGSLSREVDTVEIYTKDDENKVVYGTYITWSVDLEALYVLNDEGFALMEEKFTAKELVKVQIAMEDGNVYTGEGLITSLSMDLGQDDMVSISCSINGSGALELTKAGA